MEMMYIHLLYIHHIHIVLQNYCKKYLIID